MVDWGERLQAPVIFRWCQKLHTALPFPFLPLPSPRLPLLPGQYSPKPVGGPRRVGSLTLQGGPGEEAQWLQVRDQERRGGCPQGWQPGAGEETQNTHLWGWPMG